MVQDDGPVGLDGVRAVFDDERVVSDAGIALVLGAGLYTLHRERASLRRTPRVVAAAE